jgi:hypothetical protein
MAVQKETLRAMLRDYHGVELSDAEIELVQPELENYLAELEKLRELDLSNVMSARLLRVKEGGEP